MPRDVLLVLLALAVLLNAGILLWAASAWRAALHDEGIVSPPPHVGPEPQRPKAPDPRDVARWTPIGEASISPLDSQRRPVRRIPTRAEPAPLRTASPTPAIATPAIDERRAQAPSPEVPSPVLNESEAQPPTWSGPKPAPRAHDRPVPIDARRPKPAKSNGRARRFVLPPEEDEHRSNRAIAAFLDSHIATSAPPGRPHRRRHRARRAPGSPPPRTRMEFVLDRYPELERTVGRPAGSRVLAAFSDALRRGARSADDVREIGQGRVIVSLECDEPGATAYTNRARASVAPWLGALAVPLTMSVRSDPRVSEEHPADSA